MPLSVWFVESETVEGTFYTLPLKPANFNVDQDSMIYFNWSPSPLVQRYKITWIKIDGEEEDKEIKAAIISDDSNARELQFSMSMLDMFSTYKINIFALVENGP